MVEPEAGKEGEGEAGEKKAKGQEEEKRICEEEQT